MIGSRLSFGRKVNDSRDPVLRILNRHRRHRVVWIEEFMLIWIKKLDPSVATPRRQTDHSSGFDLEANLVERVTIAPGERRTIATGLAFEIPPGYEGQVRPRSGLSSLHGVVAAFGTIDADYRGEVGVVLFNNSFHNFKVEPHMRIAQLVICPVEYPELEVVDELSVTARGYSGFGSTGV